MDSGLQNRVIVVTGASGGIGGELARTFLREGARVVLHFHRHRERAEQAVAGCDGEHIILGGNLSDENDVANLFAEAERSLGPVDVLIANAGFWPPDHVPIENMSLDQWNQTLATNLTSSFLCCREFFRGIVRHRLTDPAAVLIGSTAGIFGEAGHADYAASKAALSYGFARTLKNEMCRIAPRGRVNVVAPGWTITPLVDRFTADPPRVRRTLQTIPLRKVARPADVASAVLYLASSKLSGHVSGQMLTVSGGMEGRVLYAPDEIDLGTA